MVDPVAAASANITGLGPECSAPLRVRTRTLQCVADDGCGSVTVVSGAICSAAQLPAVQTVIGCDAFDG